MNWFERKNNNRGGVVPVRRDLTISDDFFSMVDDFFRDWGLNTASKHLSGSINPAVNIAETANSYEIEAELPGIPKKDISIDYRDGLLTIKGAKHSLHEEKKDKYHRVERSDGSFMRTFSLPTDVDGEKITAQLDQGLLRIEVPKKVGAQTGQKKIEIK
jgi:HSP20 family protein